MYLSKSKYCKQLVLSVVMLFLTLGVWSSSSYATTTGAGTVVRITSDAETYSLGEEFIVNVEIDNPKNYYAGDISIDYDDRLFALKDVSVADTQQLRIYGQPSTTGAGTRVIVASNGPQYGMKSSQKVLKLKFVAIREGYGYVEIYSVNVADGYGNEYLLGEYFKRIRVVKQNKPDTNGDGYVSLADLGIASRLMGTSDWQWGYYQPDVNRDGEITNVDLNAIVHSMLN